jgi:hypothetical protein
MFYHHFLHEALRGATHRRLIGSNPNNEDPRPDISILNEYRKDFVLVLTTPTP